jgi:hypothetical protein
MIPMGVLPTLWEINLGYSSAAELIHTLLFALLDAGVISAPKSFS